MGLERQPNRFSCGPWALAHAFHVLGVLAEPTAIARVARTHWTAGTDERGLARAARAYDCELLARRLVDPDLARRLLARLVGRHPVLLCVDDWDHWITVVSHSKGRFVALDSLSEPVVIVVPWSELEERWRYRDEDDDGAPVEIYDLYLLRPRFRSQTRARFTVARARTLRRPENRDLALCWDRYVEDLLEICRPRSPHHVAALTMGEFLRRHRDLLVARVTYWHGGLDTGQVRRVLRNLRFVADTYGMVIPADARRRALADVAILLALWAAGQQPIAPIYVPEPRPRRMRHGAAKAQK